MKILVVNNRASVDSEVIRDREVVEYAKKQGLLLVTQDQRPAELAELLGVRYVLISNATIAKVADKEIREKFPSLKE